MGVAQPSSWPVPVPTAIWSVSCSALGGPSSRHWLGSLCIFCFLILATAAPITGPDFSQCQDATVGHPFHIHKEACCPTFNASRPIMEFSFPGQDLPLRTRRAAHRLPEDYIQKLNRAYQLMHDLPADDPRSLEQQRRMHCAYCNGAFRQPWNDGAPPHAQSTLQIHFTWLIWPWHRWFLYFHERILASLVGDDELALPFWNWDNQMDEGANQIPAAYSSSNYSGLLRERSMSSRPPAVADLGILNRIVESPAFSLAQTPKPARMRDSNLNVLHQQMVTGASTRVLFFGEPYRVGDASVDFFSPTQGLLEAGVHSAVHLWTGGDLAALDSSAKDPAFYAHHANLDRLWAAWKSLGEGRTDFADPDWLNAEFLFYDETAQLVKVKASQALDIENQLRYKYEEVKESDHEWINYIAPKCSSFKSLSETQDWIESIPLYNDTGFYLSPPNVFTTRLKRPSDDARVSNTTEVLLLENLQVNWTAFTWFHIFVNFPQSNSTYLALDCGEFIGVLNSVSHGRHGTNQINYKIGIGKKLRELGVDSLSEIVVSIVVGKNSGMNVQNLQVIMDPI